MRELRLFIAQRKPFKAPETLLPVLYTGLDHESFQAKLKEGLQKDAEADWEAEFKYVSRITYIKRDKSSDIGKIWTPYMHAHVNV